MLATKCAEKLKTFSQGRPDLPYGGTAGPMPGMRIGMSTRLFLAILATVVLSVTLVIGATRWNFERGFLGYLNELAAERLAFLEPRLAKAYQAHGNWDFLRDNPPEWFTLLRPVPGEELPAHTPTQFGMPLTSDLTGAMLRLSLLDAQDQWVMGFRELSPQALRRPVRVQGRTVGWIVLAPFQSVADTGAQRFQQGQTHAALAIGALSVALAALIASWVASRLLAPVRRVASATHLLAAGHHDTRVDLENRTDEVGQLARDFNHLAHTLARNETLRRDFMADVSHELRTPLAVLRGELEALEDGIRPLDAAAVKSLQGAVSQISDLVDDLYELALSDAGAMSHKLEPLDLRTLLARVADTHRRRIEAQGLALNLQLPATPMPALADEGRLQQLLDNLLENCRRYTDAPGEVRITTAGRDAQWHIEVHDSAPGVPAELREHLFERFFRADSSRTRENSGSGIGLTISRALVDAHGGTMAAASEGSGRGATFTIRLPRAIV